MSHMLVKIELKEQCAFDPKQGQANHSCFCIKIAKQTILDQILDDVADKVLTSTCDGNGVSHVVIGEVSEVTSYEL